MPTFREVTQRADFPAMERETLAWWQRDGIVERYLHRNDGADERFSFIDGPITANNPMGVHHAWGRTYKDLFQRYNAMLGKEQRFQNGFDCQGLWVEVEVEKELGLKSKRDIEAYGVAEFVELCKQRVRRFSKRQTDQSIRMGYWMDWDNSYFTDSEENNYTIWHFLKTCHEKGWVYKGHDTMPWCPRCGTGLSEHEIVTEGYKDRTHLSIYARLPLQDEAGADLLVWTTTPWTLPANVAAAVHPEITYARVEYTVKGEQRASYLAKDLVRKVISGQHTITAEVPGSELVGRRYTGPFDELEAAQGVEHRVIPWTDVSADEGTGIVHIAPGCGKEDFALSKVEDLPVIAPIDEFGVYVEGFADLSGRYVHEVANDILEKLTASGHVHRAEQYTHRYPVCWRCGTDLVFRLVDEWFISMNELRRTMMDVTRQINWIPSFGRERELDWLEHMDDWMISKKRYWGLALPIYVCDDCDHFEVLGSKDELRERATGGWDEFDGHTPHRPYIDAVTIACPSCGGTAHRVKDVGNPWLDAGIVPFSTLHYLTDREYWDKWFPADLISESFPGQFRNWFYSLIAQGSALTGQPAFRNVFSYALMRDENGEEMHKSKGNAIWLDDAAEEIGIDTMRWLFSTVNPTANVNFGPNITDGVRRRFILPLWNCYAFFANYARLDGFDPTAPGAVPPLAERALMDRWIVSRLNQVIAAVRERLDSHDPAGAANEIERFVVEELSNWYIRRNRRRFWRAEGDADKLAAYGTLYEVMVTVSKLLAPFVPFLADEIYGNLVRDINADAPPSVHLTDFPVSDAAAIDEKLSADMAVVLEVVNLGHAARQEGNVKVRQPLPALLVYSQRTGASSALDRLGDLITDELNVKAVRPLAVEELGDVVEYDIRPNLKVLGPRFGKRLGAVRQALGALVPADIAASVAAGQPIALALPDGEGVELAPEDVLVDLIKRSGFAAAQSASATVVLDTNLTVELIEEGLARDFVRGIQDARKDAGYRVEDRIELTWEADPEIGDALRNFERTIAGEVLATLISGQTVTGASDQVRPQAEGQTHGTAGTGSRLDDGTWVDQIQVGDHHVRIAMKQVAPVAS
ncbi:MAG TPA: isoleucine--tRNA ligase [Thermomicrobiales bacterium]|jgi:isoleucyl-tRNA synthetase|nr:isoleucine--tRNA ligase [Thermomicrobiales bacterium]